MEQDQPTVAGAQTEQAILRPVIVDLGKKSKKAIEKFKRGEGEIFDDLDETIQHVRSRLSDADKNSKIMPIVLVYTRKQKRAKVPTLPFSPMSLLR